MPSYARMPSVSAQYSIILRVEIDHRPGMLGRVATAIGDAGGSIGSVDLSSIDGLHTIRDITIDTAGEEHAQRIAQAVIAPVLRATWREVEALSETRRGAGGFGSTGI